MENFGWFVAFPLAPSNTEVVQICSIFITLLIVKDMYMFLNKLKYEKGIENDPSFYQR